MNRLFLFSLLTAILAAALTYHYQQQPYMRSLLRPSNIITTLTRSLTTTTSPKMPPFAGLPTIPPMDPSLTAPHPTPRKITLLAPAHSQSEGAGATVRRSIGTPRLRHLTPFLMLDHFTISPGAGFPDHPHRGQETITYLLSGSVDHEDFAGNKGTLQAGDLQFMTAGRGIVHAEMPGKSEGGEPNVGMQLWVDLPRDLKDCEPRYRDVRAKEIPEVRVDDGRVHVKVISGASEGVESLRELAYTPVWLLDVTIQPGGRLAQRLPKGWNAFAYTLSGTTTFETGDAGGEAEKVVVKEFHNAVFSQTGDQVIAGVPGDAQQPGRMILVAGMPLDQPIVQYGPFVVTDAAEVRKALMDYSAQTNGFERAKGWRSEIGRVMG